jgi:Fe-S oxidoreductase
MDACVHCGACSDKCHYFLGTGDPKNMPVARQDLMRAVYRRYFTFAGKHFPKLVGAVDMTQGGARRLVRLLPPVFGVPPLLVFCPYGIDTAEITMAAREIMDSVGLGQKYSNEIIGKVHKHRQQPRPARPGAGRHAARAWKRTSRKRPASTCATRWT